jgi:hypothetical protein
VDDDQTGDESYYSIYSLVTPGGIAHSDSEKAEAFADNLDTQLHLVADPSVPEFTEMFNVARKSYLMTRASELKLTDPEEIKEDIRGLKVGKYPGPIGTPNRALKHLPQRALSLLVQIINEILLNHHFRTAWKHTRVISILKAGKDPALPLS